MNNSFENKVNLLAKEIYSLRITSNKLKINNLFKLLFVLQYCFGILCAFTLSPYTWIGEIKLIHPHVYIAVILGFLILIAQFILFKFKMDSAILPYSIVTTQILQSILLIHLTNGRIETHFHIFGSLAFIAFYRNPRLIIFASILVVIDHIFRGYFYPESIYGISTIESYRWMEHAGWVIFEDVFLILSINLSRKEMQEIAIKQASIEVINSEIEEKIKEQTKELMKTNKELEQFAYIASHDLQEPLRKVITYGELLKDSISNKLTEESNLYIEKMQSSSKRMQSLILDLLQYSRYGFQEARLENIDLNLLISEVANDLEVRIKETNSTITVNNLPVIKADKSQMRQLFQNLISNSMKYSKKDINPIILIDKKKSANNNIKIIIKDNGIGFNNENAQKIFEPFKRLHTKSEYEGNGIGLAVCKKIVNKHGGDIKATSHEGEGAEFIIEFPSHLVIG